MATMSNFAIRVCRALKSGNPQAQSITCPVTNTKFPIQFGQDSYAYIDAYGTRYANGILEQIVISDIDSQETIAVLKPREIDKIKYIPPYACLRFNVTPIETTI